MSKTYIHKNKKGRMSFIPKFNSRVIKPELIWGDWYLMDSVIRESKNFEGSAINKEGRKRLEKLRVIISRQIFAYAIGALQDGTKLRSG